ncbi:MAG: zinc ABC transporter substrate-binding protein [Myxococcota bacterium]|jgi:zinc/manganese transport system substrate-binding protein|nr:zinc ABC transporter substrate-binding protein [Myxococcota bacterium]
MRNHRLLQFALVGVLGIAGVLFAASAEAKVRVVGTLPDFAAIATELGGDRVEAESLIQGTEDPHFVDPKPSHILRVNRADLLICIGLGLESGWLPVLLTQARNGRVQVGAPGYLDAAQFVQVKEVPVKADRAMGDVHGGGNPHYYVSPPEMFRVSEAIYRRLVQLDPDGRAEYDKRWQAFSKKYQEKIAAWKAALAPLAGSKVVEYHKSWIYLLDWLGFSSVGALEPKPGIPPSPSHVTQLLMKVKDQGVRFVFREVYHGDSLSGVFARKAGARLLDLPTMVGAGPDIKTIWDKWDRMVQMLSAK